MTIIDSSSPQVEQFIETFEVDLASLSDNEQKQVIETARDAQLDGTLAQFDLDANVLEAQIADDHRELAEEAQLAQAEASAAQDYETAHSAALEAQFQMDEAVAHGMDLGAATAANDHDVQVLEAADWQQEITAENLVEADAWIDAATDSATGGDLESAGDFLEVAEVSLDAAGDSYELADSWAADSNDQIDPVDYSLDTDFD